ncbi:S-layer homology domain-containing protein [Deferribacter autotrophicus]|uniref:S-layer homology domain-containing protein n=1 Tax=Deferribacter autotrophicus TaxID=500465 RepID=A0A5A8F502_9BACT|nr:S-layer homology domain-containing protein [Deferribacter autotrophicus]KAA0258135.1 S-layer homology domain-containing protein [Deferribacter autotrophicus]
MKRNILLLFTVITAFIFVSCSKPKTVCNLPTDNPQHNYFTGMELLEKGDVNNANMKFERSIQCDPKYSPGYAGKSLALAMIANTKNDMGEKQVWVERSLESLKKAKKYAKNKAQEYVYYVTAIRTYTELRIEDWLDKVKDFYDDAKDIEKRVNFNELPYYQGPEALEYFMGVAYLKGEKFQKARDAFAGVLNMSRQSKWHASANTMWKKADKIVRAMAGITVGNVGKKIAVKDAVSRADFAALLVDELRIEKIMEGRIPVKSKIAKMNPEFIPADILNNPFRPEIEIVLKWNIRGLSPIYDETTKAYLFFPNKPLTRKEFALILEDVLVKLTGDESLPRKYFGQENSPYPDVRATAPWFNAVMNVVTRGLMETELSGEFRPDDYVDGAEALLAIRVLRQTLNVY